jgi:cyclophilin family peptidyl-prolyl cis-trans isomerase
MARSQDPNSAGSQFFIVLKDSKFLDGKYTVFGKVTSGMVNRNFYENAIKTNEQWFKALWDPWLKAGNPSQRKKR